ncbi:MAG: hypothetical protein H7Z40_13280 [Phycisphaerae bacterium]|nr:hypothetical protein [Gemmatimonadaceae bacterium]
MSDKSTPYKHDASDKKLDKSAEMAESHEKDTDSASHAGHDPEKIRKHDDAGKDRMFEGREQHDLHDLESEKNRLAKERSREKPPIGDAADVTPANMHVKRKD